MDFAQQTIDLARQNVIEDGQILAESANKVCPEP
jgi:hypothetical protein